MANTVNYFEIGSPDPQASRAFYGGLFDWDIGEPSMPSGYSSVEGPAGGLWDSTAVGGANWAIFYVQVDDIRGAIERATGLGATIVIPLIDNGDIEFAHLADPLGNRFGVWRPKTAG
jgi:predicted enzyme related to lactoylglutathione lyase